MSRSEPIELGLTIPLQRHLRIKAPLYGQEPDRRFCWDLHVITLRGQPSPLDQIVNAKPNRCVGYQELDAAICGGAAFSSPETASAGMKPFSAF